LEGNGIHIGFIGIQHVIKNHCWQYTHLGLHFLFNCCSFCRYCDCVPSVSSLVFMLPGYDAMGYAMSKPYLRAQLEADLCKLVMQILCVMQMLILCYVAVKFSDII